MSPGVKIRNVQCPLSRNFHGPLRVSTIWAPHFDKFLEVGKQPKNMPRLSGDLFVDFSFCPFEDCQRPSDRLSFFGREPFHWHSCKDLPQEGLALAQALFLISSHSLVQSNLFEDIRFMGSHGLLAVRVFVDCEWQSIVVDTRLPTQMDAVLHTREGDLWVPFLEKGLAKFFGSYEALRRQSLWDLMHLLTGSTMSQEPVTFSQLGNPIAFLDKKIQAGALLILAAQSPLQSESEFMNNLCEVVDAHKLDESLEHNNILRLRSFRAERMFQTTSCLAKHLHPILVREEFDITKNFLTDDEDSEGFSEESDSDQGEDLWWATWDEVCALFGGLTVCQPWLYPAPLNQCQQIRRGSPMAWGPLKPWPARDHWQDPWFLEHPQYLLHFGTRKAPITVQCTVYRQGSEGVFGSLLLHKTEDNLGDTPQGTSAHLRVWQPGQAKKIHRHEGCGRTLHFEVGVDAGPTAYVLVIYQKTRHPVTFGFRVVAPVALQIQELDPPSALLVQDKLATCLPSPAFRQSWGLLPQIWIPPSDVGTLLRITLARPPGDTQPLGFHLFRVDHKPNERATLALGPPAHKAEGHEEGDPTCMLKVSKGLVVVLFPNEALLTQGWYDLQLVSSGPLDAQEILKLPAYPHFVPGCWGPLNAGGARTGQSPEIQGDWLQNPRIPFEVRAPCTLLGVLTKEGRSWKKIPASGQLGAMLALVLVALPLGSPGSERILAEADMVPEDSLKLEVPLQPGSYALMVSTFAAGVQGHYSVFLSSQPPRALELESTDHTSNHT